MSGSMYDVTDDPEVVKAMLARKRAEALLAAGQQPDGHMVDGIYVQPHPLQRLAALLSTGIGAYKMRGAERGMNDAMTKAAAIRRAQADAAMQQAADKLTLERDRLDLGNRSLAAKDTWQKMLDARSGRGQDLTARQLDIRDQMNRQNAEEFAARQALLERRQAFREGQGAPPPGAGPTVIPVPPMPPMPPGPMGPPPGGPGPGAVPGGLPDIGAMMPPVPGGPPPGLSMPGDEPDMPGAPDEPDLGPMPPGMGLGVPGLQPPAMRPTVLPAAPAAVPGAGAPLRRGRKRKAGTGVDNLLRKYGVK